MIRKDGKMLTKIENLKGKNGFRKEDWRDPYEYAAEQILMNINTRSIERGVERCRVTISKEELIALIKRSPCTPFFGPESPHYRLFIWARAGVGETLQKLTCFTSCLSLSMNLSFRNFPSD